MFLDKKTLLRGTAPGSLQKSRSSYYKIRKLLQNTVTFVTKCISYYKMRRYQRMCFLFLYHGVFSFFATLIGNYSGSLRDAEVVKDIRPLFIKAITTGNFKKIIDSKKHSQALIPRYSNNKVSALGTAALTKKLSSSRHDFSFPNYSRAFQCIMGNKIWFTTHASKFCNHMTVRPWAPGESM